MKTSKYLKGKATDKSTAVGLAIGMEALMAKTNIREEIIKLKDDIDMLKKILRIHIIAQGTHESWFDCGDGKSLLDFLVK